ncbi:MAG: hypothetical protein Q9162_005881 [Coniocarpon cinnabarinum]
MSRPEASANGLPVSALRPRNKRLISGLDDPTDDPPRRSTPDNVVTAFAPTPLESPSNSRVPSPIPSTHPSRSPSHNRSNFFNGSPSGRNADQLGSDLANQLSGLWGKSWTSLQGLANNVLGSDTSQEMFKDKSPARNRRPFEATHGTKQQWGPSSREPSQPGVGSKEARRALVRERKRQELLMSTADPSMDPLRVKRRTSDDFESTSAPPGENEDRDIMVYIHSVVVTDTIAGISIKYGCPMPVLKKANRMYSDVVQTRKSMLVPVDACTVKGRRCQSPPTTAPASPKLDGSISDKDKTPRAQQQGFGDTAFGAAAMPSPPHSGTYRIPRSMPSPALSQKTEDEKPWRHDSWVQLLDHSNPTEIVRMSRRDLGFFPRARRKSVSYSDLDTPSASFDLPRPSITINDTTSARSVTAQHRKRGSSGSAKGSAGLSWAAQMSGPGGVGNLRGKGDSTPGPAQDKFTRAMSKHLPSMAPPQEGVFSEEDEEEAYSPGGATPLEQIGGQIEGWMRGVGKKINEAYKTQQGPGGGLAVPSVPGMKRTNSRTKQGDEGPGLGLGSTSGGDLIELSNAFEIGEEDWDAEDRFGMDGRRGRPRTSEGRKLSAQRTGRDYWDDGGKRKGD